MQGDPYKYFRIEARELLEALTQGFLELENGRASKDLIGRLLRSAHTLKGASRIVKQARISDLSHAIEDVLSPYREGQAPVPRGAVSELLGMIDEIGACLQSLDGGAAQEPGRAAPGVSQPPRIGEEALDTVRVEIRDMDAVLHGISSLSVQIAAFREQAATLDQLIREGGARGGSLGGGRADVPAGQNDAAQGAFASQEAIDALKQLGRRFGNVVDRAERELGQVQEKIAHLRLLPVGVLFASLERAVRDAAVALEKRAEFEASGGENRLDAHVLRALREVLIHVVRNAIVHGIEKEAERISAGKPPAGRIQVGVERRGSRVMLMCQDDGRGIDVEQIRRVAVDRGLVSPAEGIELGLEDSVRLAMQGGFSTARAVSQMAGRGIGLDVVRAMVAGLKGEVNIHSERGRGTRVELLVPISLESLTVLDVEAGGMTVSIPFEAVASTVRVKPGEIVASADGESILYEGRTVPFAALAGVLRLDMPPRAGARPIPAAVLRAGSSLAAVGVDRLLRRGRLVMRSLPALSGRVPLVAGASLDSEGNPQLVMDAVGLVSAVRAHRGPAMPPSPPPKPPLLVIDDSLTTRMLEQSILETAGFEVDLAVSGEDGLAKARQRRYAAFVVDIEMPGIDGFEFIERAQASPELRGIPSILVTSRASQEDRKRGAAVGARAYIVKSEFDEGQLLRTIRSLVG